MGMQRNKFGMYEHIQGYRYHSLRNYFHLSLIVYCLYRYGKLRDSSFSLHERRLKNSYEDIKEDRMKSVYIPLHAFPSVHEGVLVSGCKLWSFLMNPNLLPHKTS